MIITVGGTKGGIGKSTIATNLTVWLTKRTAADVLLVDTDRQGTSSQFVTHRRARLGEDNTGFTSVKLFDEDVRGEIKSLRKKFDHIIIDTGGFDSVSQRAAMSIADTYLLPFQPRSFDLWTAETVVGLLAQIRAMREAPLEAYAFLNRADSKGADNQASGDFLAETSGITFLRDASVGNRKIFSNAGSIGLGVIEYRPEDAKACAELERLFSTITQNVFA